MRTILDMMSTSFWPAKSWEFGSSVKLERRCVKKGNIRCVLRVYFGGGCSWSLLCSEHWRGLRVLSSGRVTRGSRESYYNLWRPLQCLPRNWFGVYRVQQLGDKKTRSLNNLCTLLMSPQIDIIGGLCHNRFTRVWTLDHSATSLIWYFLPQHLFSQRNKITIKMRETMLQFLE